MQRMLLSLSIPGVMLLAACSPKQDTIRIGYVGPLTGDAASYGNDTLNGVRIAVDEMNAAGGVEGRMIELIAEDGRCNGSDAASAAQKLINIDKVVAIVGGQCSSETLAIAPIAEAAKVVVISPLSSNPTITDAGAYIFRITPSDALKGKALDEHIRTAGYTKIAMLSENTDYCQGFRGAVKENLPDGVTLVFDEVVDQGTKDYRTLMTRLKDMEFDALITNGQGDATIEEMVKQARALGITQQFLGTEVADSNRLGEAATEAVEGMKALSTPSLDESAAAAKEFATVFRQRYDEPQQTMYFASLGYDALKLAAVSALKDTPEGRTQYLNDLERHSGLSGTFHFDENGDVVGQALALKVFKDGTLSQSEVITIPE